MYGQVYRKVGDEVSVHTRMLSWGKRSEDATAANCFQLPEGGGGLRQVHSELLRYREELEQERPVPEHEEPIGASSSARDTPAGLEGVVQQRGDRDVPERLRGGSSSCSRRSSRTLSRRRDSTVRRTSWKSASTT